MASPEWIEAVAARLCVCKGTLRGPCPLYEHQRLREAIAAGIARGEEERMTAIVEILRDYARRERTEAEADPECFEEPDGAIALEMAIKKIVATFGSAPSGTQRSKETDQ